YNALYWRAVANVKLKQPDQAIADLQQAIAKGYKDPEQLKNDTHLEPLRTREDFKKLVAGLEANSTIVGPQADQWQAWKNRGSARARLQQWDQAIADYGQAFDLLEKQVSQSPQMGEYRQQLAESQASVVTELKAGGRPGDAEKVYRRAIKFYEKLAAAHA